MRSHTNKSRVFDLMQRIGNSVRTEGRIYFTGGVTAVLMGWRDMTIDVDLKAEPEPLGFFECLPAIKEELDINIELASPDQFVPALPGWESRSLFIQRSGRVDFFHYDLYAQALSKIERDHPRDRLDVECMFRDEHVKPDRLQELFAQIEHQLIRYPSVDAITLKHRLMDVCADHL